MVKGPCAKRRVVALLVKKDGTTFIGTNDVNNPQKVSYVVATNPDAAYMMVKSYLDQCSIGFSASREMSSIELIAENTRNPACGTILYTSQEVL
jgi:hypothetical protein